MRISDWSSDVCSSDLRPEAGERNHGRSQHDEQPVGDRAFDDPGDHCPLACLIALMRALLSSCTKRKLTLSPRSEEHTSELQSLMRISYAVFCLKKKIQTTTTRYIKHTHPL